MIDNVTEPKRRKDALKWLATVRQAKIDEATAAAFLTGVSDLPAWAVEAACREIGYRARDEHELAWPDLGTIRSIAQARIRADDARKAHERMLPPAERIQPISPEKWAEIRAKFQEVLKRKVMP